MFQLFVPTVDQWREDNSWTGPEPSLSGPFLDCPSPSGAYRAETMEGHLSSLRSDSSPERLHPFTLSSKCPRGPPEEPGEHMQQKSLWSSSQSVHPSSVTAVSMVTVSLNAVVFFVTNAIKYEVNQSKLFLPGSKGLGPWFGPLHEKISKIREVTDDKVPLWFSNIPCATNKTKEKEQRFGPPAAPPCGRYQEFFSSWRNVLHSSSLTFWALLSWGLSTDFQWCSGQQPLEVATSCGHTVAGVAEDRWSTTPEAARTSWRSSADKAGSDLFSLIAFCLPELILTSTIVFFIHQFVDGGNELSSRLLVFFCCLAIRPCDCPSSRQLIRGTTAAACRDRLEQFVCSQSFVISISWPLLYTSHDANRLMKRWYLGPSYVRAPGPFSLFPFSV